MSDLKQAQIDIEDNPYLKQIKDQQRQKINDKKKLPIPILSKNAEIAEESEQSDFSYTKKKKKEKQLFNEEFKDKVFLSSKNWTNANSKKDNIENKKIETLIEKRKYNAKDIIKHMGHEVNFSKRKEELKEMLRHNIQEARSPNKFVASFSDFKVGIVNQILTFLDVPLAEIKQIKKEALDELVQENTNEMEENLYHLELLEILHGKTKKARKQSTIFNHLKLDLTIQMNKIFDHNYWTFEKIQEVKIKQCKKILDEFKDEQKHLEYTLETLQQRKISGDSNESKKII